MTTETIGRLDHNEITFPKLGIDLHLDSTAFSIGGLDIQWYGILITLGLVLAKMCIRDSRYSRRVPDGAGVPDCCNPSSGYPCSG